MKTFLFLSVILFVLQLGDTLSYTAQTTESHWTDKACVTPTFDFTIVPKEERIALVIYNIPRRLPIVRVTGNEIIASDAVVSLHLKDEELWFIFCESGKAMGTYR